MLAPSVPDMGYDVIPDPSPENLSGNKVFEKE
jgi:hypothetical protein